MHVPFWLWVFLPALFFLHLFWTSSLIAGGTGLAESVTRDRSPTVKHGSTGKEPGVSLTT